MDYDFEENAVIKQAVAVIFLQRAYNAATLALLS
jgi:hypothetical protein